MNWEEKLERLREIGDHSLKMTTPGSWQVISDLELGGEDGIIDGFFGRGDTPEKAVEAHWDYFTNIPASRYVISRIDGVRRHYQWSANGWVCVDKIKRYYVKATFEKEGYVTAANEEDASKAFVSRHRGEWSEWDIILVEEVDE